MTNGESASPEPTDRPAPNAPPSSAELLEIRDFHLRLLRLTPYSLVTWTLIGANVLVYAANVLAGIDPMSPDAERLVEWGAEYGPRTLRGEWWRVLTSAFLHGGVWHIAVNMWVLYALGRFGERLFGHLGFLVLYLVSAVAGAVASLWWNPAGISVGASGAIFGLIGGLLGVAVTRNPTVPARMLNSFRSSATSFLVYNLAFGLMFPFIDNAAHLGGFVGGILCGMMLSRPVRDDGPHNWTLRALLVLVVGVAGLGGLALVVLPEPPGDYLAAETLFLEVQESATEKAVEYEEQWSRQAIDGGQFAALLRKNVIPDWERAVRGLEELDGLSGDLAKRLGLMERFARARLEFLKAYADQADGDVAARLRMERHDGEAKDALAEMERLNRSSGWLGRLFGRE